MKTGTRKAKSRKPKCTGPQCSRPVHASALCKTHYEQKRAKRPLRPIRSTVRRGSVLTCTFDGCDRAHSSKGLCQAHYDQKKKRKPLTPIRSWVSQEQWGETCRYPGCGKDKRWRGLCTTHYGRGISQFARDAILEAQDSRCLCGAIEPGPAGWHLDHFHEHSCSHAPDNYCADCVRGMLCLACNRHAIAWYESTYRVNPVNPPIPLFERWVSRRLRFSGDLDSPDVTVTIRQARGT